MKKFFTKRLSDRHLYLVRLVWGHKYRLLFAMFCMQIVAASTAGSAYLIRPVMDEIFIDGDVDKLLYIPAAVVVLYLLRGLGMYGQAYLMNYVGESVIRHFRNQLYAKIMDMPLAFFHEKKTGVLMARITNDVNVVRGMVTNAVTTSLKDFFTVLFLLGVIFFQIWKLAVFAFVVLPIAYYPIVYFGRKVRKVSTGCQEAMAELNSFLHETFSGAKIVKAFGREGYEKRRFQERTGTLFYLEMKNIIAQSMSSPFMEFLAGVAIAFIIWYGGSQVIEGTYTAGQFISFLAAVLMLYDPVKKLASLNNAVQQGLAAAERIFDVMEEENTISEKKDAVDIPHGPHGVTFENVSFKYDRDSVLKDINLSVSPGEVLALAGMSGGGKSSLVNLIPRFYDVTGGQILIDGIPVTDASIKSLRSQIAIVTQEPILFHATIRDNIAYGNPSAGEDDIIAAAKAAYAHDYIESLPSGYDTNIGELGGRLSGGERQRLCIARALLKDAPILILDEATSSLDAEAEAVVQKALENLMQGRTTFVIAHRLSTITHADRIAVIVGGEIKEMGNHEALISSGGEYEKLFRMQFGGDT